MWVCSRVVGNPREFLQNTAPCGWVGFVVGAWKEILSTAAALLTWGGHARLLSIPGPFPIGYTYTLILLEQLFLGQINPQPNSDCQEMHGVLWHWLCVRTRGRELWWASGRTLVEKEQVEEHLKWDQQPAALRSSLEDTYVMDHTLLGLTQPSRREML